MTMIASTTPGYHNPRITAQTVTNRLREIGEKTYTMYVLYAAFLFMPSIYFVEYVENIRIFMSAYESDNFDVFNSLVLFGTY